MPGVFGGCSLADGRAIPQAVLRLMARQLQCEPTDRTSLPEPGSPAGVAVVDPGIRADLASYRDFPNRRLAISIYGELYHPDVTDSQDPLGYLARWYAKQPASAADRAAELDGSFVIAIHDYGEGRLLLISDHTGTRQLYYTVIGNTLYFAPELRGLACLDGFDDSVSLGCLVSLLANGFWIGNATLYANVQSIPQASALELRPGGVRINRYWTYDFDEDATDEGLDHYVEELATLLRRATEKQLDAIPDKSSMIVPISGGYDSRGILACIREQYDGPLRTVTWGTDESDPAADGFLGRRVAEALGTEHHFMARTGTGNQTADVVEMVRRLEASNDDPLHHRTELTTMRRIRDLGVTDLFRGDKLFGYHPAVQSDAEALGFIGYPQSKDVGYAVNLIAPELREAAREEYDALVQQLRSSTALQDPSNRKD